MREPPAALVAPRIPEPGAVGRDSWGWAFSLGRGVYGLAILASGVLQLVTGAFVRLVTAPPTWTPPRPAWAYLVGAVLLACGLAVLFGWMARTAATVVGAMILLLVAAVYPPSMLADPRIDTPLLRGFMYTNPLKCLALIGGAAVLAARFPDRPHTFSAVGRGIGRLEPIAAALLAAFLAVCGIQHFWYSAFVKDLVPAWIPGGQLSWTYFTGVALFAGGVGILVPRTARLAAALSALMIFLWVLLLHIPRAVAGPEHRFETAGAFEALALSGVALLMAARSTRR